MDWKSVIGKAAPYLGAALGGPLGSVALSTVADALGLSEKTEGAIKQALSGASPEQMMAVKVAEQGFAIRMRELGFANAKDMEALAVGDRASARQREMSVMDKTPRNLAYGITLGFFGVLIFLMLGSVQDGMKEVLFMMLGALGSSWTSCINYFYGSSKSSQAKTELLAKADAIKE